VQGFYSASRWSTSWRTSCEGGLRSGMMQAMPAEASPVELETARLLVTMPAPDQASLLVAYFVDNRRHLERWSPPRPPGFYTTEFWRWRLEQNRIDYAEDRSLRLSLFERDRPGGPVLGQVSFTELVRGPLQSCLLGYNIDRLRQAQGLMSEALEVSIRFAFERMTLHRVSANYMPSNARSAAVLRRLGFAVEGYAKSYLYIDGAWRDHVLTSRLNPRGAPPGVSVR
jgi:ribosomal-protein-alanine N-acetyltransferase